MYLQTYPEAALGPAARDQIYCTEKPIILDDFRIGDYRVRPQALNVVGTRTGMDSLRLNAECKSPQLLTSEEY
jgi:hypothetical protein